MKRAAIDVAIAHPVLQRDVPLPAAFMRSGAGEGSGAPVCAGHRHRAVARQPVRPVLVARFERLLDQQAAKARAVDEQVACDELAVGRAGPSRQAVLAAQLDARRSCLRSGARRRARLTAQERGVQAGVEVEGIGTGRAASGASAAGPGETCPRRPRPRSYEYRECRADRAALALAQPTDETPRR